MLSIVGSRFSHVRTQLTLVNACTFHMETDVRINSVSATSLVRAMGTGMVVSRNLSHGRLSAVEHMSTETLFGSGAEITWLACKKLGNS